MTDPQNPPQDGPDDPKSQTAFGHLLPRIGSVWTRDGKTFRTVGKHRFNEWGQCWHVQFAETKEGEIGVRWVSLRQFHNWAHTAKQVCDRCWGRRVVDGTPCTHCQIDWKSAAYEAARNEGTE